MNPAIVMFAKAPEPGRVKTRLAATIGDQAAAALHGAFITDLAGVMAKTSAATYLAYAPTIDHPGFDAARAKGLEPIEQGVGDLGDRLTLVSQALFAKGHDALVIIGSDSPTLSVECFEAAFEGLSHSDVYLGPSFDGGYYLIGLSCPSSAPFEGIVWSTEDVAQTTVARCREAGLTLTLGPWWYDVDEIGDLRRLRFHLLDVLCNDAATWCPETSQLLAQLVGEGRIL